MHTEYMQYNISNSSFESIRPNHTYRGTPANKYQALKDQEQEKMIAQLYDSFGEDDVNSVLSPLWDWKQSSYGNYAKTHERLLDASFGIGQPLRNGDLVSTDPTKNQEEIISELYDVTQTFLSDRFGSELTVYRGMKYQLPKFMKEILGSPSINQIDANFSCLCNFTTKETIAQSFGLALLKVDVNSEDVLLAPDFILKQKRDGDIINKDAEVRLRGDFTQSLSINDIVFTDSMTPIKPKLFNPNRCTKTEHEEIAGIISYIDKTGMNITDPNSAQRLWKWYDAYRDSLSPQEHYLINRVEKHLKSICLA